MDQSVAMDITTISLNHNLLSCARTPRKYLVLNSTRVCAHNPHCAQVFNLYIIDKACWAGEGCFQGHLCPRGPSCIFLKQGKCRFTGSTSFHHLFSSTPILSTENMHDLDASKIPRTKRNLSKPVGADTTSSSSSISAHTPSFSGTPFHSPSKGSNSTLPAAFPTNSPTSPPGYPPTPLDIRGFFRS
jgi:hypothetical protein